MLEKARRRCASLPKLRFEHVDGPGLPFEDDSFELAISLLSFRYLDWDPLMRELRRVLAPGGRLVVVDMVTAPVAIREWPRALRDALLHRLRRRRRPEFDRSLSRLVAAPAWADMLRENPIRAEHELRWYLESRFPGRRVETLNIGRQNRMLAFDSGSFERGRLLEDNSHGTAT
jgi:SAM-dependent methyltransferase